MDLGSTNYEVRNGKRQQYLKINAAEQSINFRARETKDLSDIDKVLVKCISLRQKLMRYV